MNTNTHMCMFEEKLIYLQPKFLLPWGIYPHSDPWDHFYAAEAPNILTIGWVKINLSSTELVAAWDLHIKVTEVSHPGILVITMPILLWSTPCKLLTMEDIEFLKDINKGDMV